MAEIYVEPAWAKFRPPFKKVHVSKHEICNETNEPVAFKIKSSDSDNLRATPIYGLIKPKNKFSIAVKCLRQRPPRADLQDKVKVCLKAIDQKDADNFFRNPTRNAKDFFRDEQIHGFVEVFVVTKALELGRSDYRKNPSSAHSSMTSQSRTSKMDVARKRESKTCSVTSSHDNRRAATDPIHQQRQSDRKKNNRKRY